MKLTREILYEGCEVYGPYVGKDGRMRVILRKNKKNKTVSYPKYLMEIHLGKYLKKGLEINHKDKNPLNNSIENLEILTRKEHQEFHRQFIKKDCHYCLFCNKYFEVTGNKRKSIIDSRRKGCKGPFCSRSCAAKQQGLDGKLFGRR